MDPELLSDLVDYDRHRDKVHLSFSLTRSLARARARALSLPHYLSYAHVRARVLSLPDTPPPSLPSHTQPHSLYRL